MGASRFTLPFTRKCGAALAPFAIILVVGGNAVCAQTTVAGLRPDQRPEGAPTIRTFEQSRAWRQAATAGVTAPLPPSLKFLDNQGAWYTPFNRRGMPGPYDIRKLHRN